MATTVSEVESLRIEMLFVDGDTRTLSIRNPKADLTSNEISALNTFMQTNNIVLGDKDASTFGRIKQAVRVSERRINFDLNEDPE